MMIKMTRIYFLLACLVGLTSVNVQASQEVCARPIVECPSEKAFNVSFLLMAGFAKDINERFTTKDIGCFKKAVRDDCGDSGVKEVCGCLKEIINSPEGTVRNAVIDSSSKPVADTKSDRADAIKKMKIAKDALQKILDNEKNNNKQLDKTVAQKMPKTPSPKIDELMRNLNAAAKELIAANQKYASEFVKNIPDLQNACITVQAYNVSERIPSDRVLKFLKEKRPAIADGPSVKREDISEAKRLLVKELLSGKSKAAIMASLPDNMKSTVDRMITKNPEIVRDLATYADSNIVWKKIISENPDKNYHEQFINIFSTEDTSRAAEEINEFLNRTEIIDAQGIAESERADKSKELQERFKKMPPGFFSNNELMNKAYRSRRMLSPQVCSDDNLFMANNPDAATNRTRCFQTYEELCKIEAVDAESTNLSEKDEENIQTYMDELNKKKQFYDDKMNKYKDAVKDTCGAKHAINKEIAKALGLPKNTELTRAEFKSHICAPNSKYDFKGDNKTTLCANPETEIDLLTNKYIAAYNNDKIEGIPQSVIALGNNDTGKSVADTDQVTAEAVTIVEHVAKNSDHIDTGLLDDLLSGLDKPKAASSSSATSAQNAPVASAVESIVNSVAQATTSIAPAVNDNVQSYLNGDIPAASILPASFVDASTSQVAAAKASVDQGIDQVSQKLKEYESKQENAQGNYREEVSILRQQLEELQKTSAVLKAELESEKATKVADASLAARSPASASVVGVNPTVSSATQSAQQQAAQPSKTYENMFADGSFHNIPTSSASRSLNNRVAAAKTSNDALLSIYTDKDVVRSVDIANSSNPSANILIVGNAIEMQESTARGKLETKEIVVDKASLELARTNPEALRKLIEKNQMKNHVGILTLKDNNTELNYILRKDERGKLVVLPLNIARKATRSGMLNEFTQAAN